MDNLIGLLSSAVGADKVRRNEPMSAHTTFRIGGPADIWIEPDGEDALCAAIRLCRETRTPYYLIGNGSNLLVGDGGVRGAVISTRQRMNRVTVGEVLPGEPSGRLIAEAGALLSRAAAEACGAGLAGLEFASGIPGSVGGAAVMNAGAYGGEMRRVISRARVLTEEGRAEWVPAERLELSYRTSRLQREGGIVTAVEFYLAPDDPDAIRGRMETLNRRRREKQPLEFPSAGSTFKRPEGFFAGKLIMEAGLAGYTVGGAQVSEKHCGFVINRGDARAADVLELCRRIRERVYERFGVTLEMEVRTLGL